MDGLDQQKRATSGQAKRPRLLLQFAVAIIQPVARGSSAEGLWGDAAKLALLTSKLAAGPSPFSRPGGNRC